MVVDAALWGIFAAAVALITFGCRMTRPVPKAPEKPFEERIDQAA